MSRLRLGIADLFHGRPLAWGFLSGQHSEVASVEVYPHRRVLPLLLEGVLDVGLVSSLDVAVHPELGTVPDLCVAAAGGSRGLRVISDQPLAELETLYVDDVSRSAAILSAVVAGELVGHPFRVVTSPPESGRFAEVSEGVAALRAPSGALDVTAAWRGISGCPAVLALWAIRPGLDVAEASFYFKSSLRFGMTALDNLARETAAEIGVDAHSVFDYFSEDLGYVLGSAERRGLAMLAERAAAAGLIECREVAI